MTEPPKFKFLDDNCASEDLTEDKTHQRIADQLYDLITSGNPDGMTIGLEGDWGSGKSTVIELLRQKLEPSNESKTLLSRLRKLFPKRKKSLKTFFFYVDAWEHEGNPLRRVFLEALIDKLEKSPVLSRQTKNKLEKIRERVAVKKSATKLTGLGLLLAVLGLLMPLVAEQIPAISPPVPWQNVAKFFQGLNIGIVFLCIVGVLLVWQILKVVFAKLGKPAVFSTERTTGVSLENERTSIEFSMCFDEILEAITPDFDQIVMVIDNLDRINPKDALRGWSTLQTFVQRKNPLGERKKGIAKWIIVPYAEEGFGRVWDDRLGDTNVSRENKKEEGAEENQETFELNGESRGAKRLASFMDKTFDLRIHVPNMILGDWQAFAKDCILKVEPKFSATDVGTILSALVWTRKRLEDAPSPRQIKLYVNHVLLLCQLHRGRVSLDAICFYVITRYLDEGLTDEEIKKALVNGEINKDSFPPYSGPLVPEMAAIVFNTDTTRAVRLLLEMTLRTTLGNRNIDSLQTYKERFGDVFDDVFGHILSQTSSRDFPGFIALLQRTSAGMSERLYGYVSRRMKIECDAISRNISSLGHPNALALIEFANRDQDLSMEFAKKYFSERIYNFSHSEYPFHDIFADLPEISLGTFLLQKLEEVKNAAKQDVQIPCQELIDGKFAFDKLSREEMEQFLAYISDLDAADKHLAEILLTPPAQWPQWMPNWFGALTAHGLTCIENIIQALETVLNSQVNIFQTDSKDTFLEMLVALESIPYSARPIERIRKMLLVIGNRVSPNEQNSHLHFLLAKYQENDVDNTGAMEADFTHVVASYRSFMRQDDLALGEKIYRYTALSDEREWLACMIARPQRKLGGRIVEAALNANDPYLFNVKSPYKFLSNMQSMVKSAVWDKLLEYFTSDSNRLIALADSSGERLTAHPIVCRDLLASCKDAALQAKLMAKCRHELQTMTHDQWQDACKNTEIVGLLSYLEQRTEPLNLGKEFELVFEDILIQGLAKGKTYKGDYKDFVTMWHFLDERCQKELATLMGCKLLEAHAKVPEGEIRQFLVEVPDYSEWLQESQAETGQKLKALAIPSDVPKLELFSEILAHQQSRGTWWASIRKTLSGPVAHLANFQNSRVQESVQRIIGNLELDGTSE